MTTAVVVFILSRVAPPVESDARNFHGGVVAYMLLVGMFQDLALVFYLIK